MAAALKSSTFTVLKTHLSFTGRADIARVATTEEIDTG
jgi:hypothetical protein